MSELLIWMNGEWVQLPADFPAALAQPVFEGARLHLEHFNRGA
jgi:hypothetical protein